MIVLLVAIEVSNVIFLLFFWDFQSLSIYFFIIFLSWFMIFLSSLCFSFNKYILFCHCFAAYRVMVVEKVAAVILHISEFHYNTNLLENLGQQDESYECWTPCYKGKISMYRGSVGFMGLLSHNHVSTSSLWLAYFIWMVP